MCDRSQDFKKALVYLKRALVFESKLEEMEEGDMLASTVNETENEHEHETAKFIKCNSAGTILNICAILSKLNR